jgi:hypothetical protein
VNDNPDVETTVVHCEYQAFSDFPIELPFSTTELYMQGTQVHTLPASINSTAFNVAGAPYYIPLQKLQVLRLDKTKIKNITYDCFSGSSFSNLQWVFMPLGIKVFEKTNLQVLNRDAPNGFKAVKPNPLENRDFILWVCSSCSPIEDSGLL